MEADRTIGRRREALVSHEFRCTPLTSAVTRFGALFAALLLGCVTLAAAPARFDVFDVFIGYDGVVPEGSWFPVVCEIENKGPGFNATFELSPKGQGQSRELPLELPTGTRKRFVMPVFSGHRYSPGWEARLLDERGRLRAEALVRPVRKQKVWQMPLLGAVCRTTAGKPVFPEAKNKSGDLQLECARLQPELFPDSPLALEGLDTIYLNTELALEDKFREPQVKALIAWLHGGGHLIVGVEQLTHINGTPWLRGLLPCDLTGMTSAPAHGALDGWLRSARRFDGRDYVFGEPQAPAPPPAPAVPLVQTNKSKRPPPKPVTAPPGPIVNPYASLPADAAFESAPLQIATGVLRDGRALIGTGDAPLVITARRGRGQITVLTFSPEREPFVSWKNRPHFWAKLTGVPPEILVAEQHNRYGSQSIDGVFGAMIDSKQVRKLPVGWLLLLLVGYLAVIGPLDQYWLKKIGKQMFTWVTFPVYVAFFSGLIYVIGYKLRAGESEWNELHIVDVVPFGERADWRGRSYASIYSPVNARYQLESDLTYAALRGEFLGNLGGGGDASRARIAQRGNNFVAEISVPVWTSQLYVNDWWRQGPLPLGVAVSASRTGLSVTVDNKLETKLTDARLVIGGQVIALGEVPAGMSRTFDVAKTGETLKNFVQTNAKNFQQAVNQRQQAFGENRTFIENAVPATMAASFISQYDSRVNQPGAYNPGSFITPPGFDLTPLMERGDAVLLAWAADYAPVKGINRFTARRSHRDTLLRVATTVK